MSEEPLECVEFAAPFNSRTDGYQVPSGGSHASAAGVSSYDWPDFSIGSDNLYPKILKMRHLLISYQPTEMVASLHHIMDASQFFHQQGS